MATSTAGSKPATRQRRRDERGRFVKEDAARARQPRRRTRPASTTSRGGGIQSASSRGGSTRSATSPGTTSSRAAAPKPANGARQGVPAKLVALAVLVPAVAAGALAVIPRLLKHR